MNTTSVSLKLQWWEWLLIAALAGYNTYQILPFFDPQAHWYHWVVFGAPLLLIQTIAYSAITRGLYLIVESGKARWQSISAVIVLLLGGIFTSYLFGANMAVFLRYAPMELFGWLLADNFTSWMVLFETTMFAELIPMLLISGINWIRVIGEAGHE